MSVNGLRGLAAAGALMALAATSAAREFESFGSAYRYARQRQSERDAEYLAGQAARKSKDKTHGIKSKGRRGARVRSKLALRNRKSRPGADTGAMRKCHSTPAMQIKPGWRKVRRISSIWLTLTRG